MTDVLPALDPARLADLRALAGPDMPDLAEEVAQIFLQASRDGMQRLSAAAAAGETDAVVHEAHQLKGSSANVGAMQLAALCGSIEHLARHEQQIDAEKVGHAAEELGRVVEALHAEFDL